MRRLIRDAAAIRSQEAGNRGNGRGEGKGRRGDGWKQVSTKFCNYKCRNSLRLSPAVIFFALFTTIFLSRTTVAAAGAAASLRHLHRYHFYGGNNWTANGPSDRSFKIKILIRLLPIFAFASRQCALPKKTNNKKQNAKKEQKTEWKVKRKRRRKIFRYGEMGRDDDKRRKRIKSQVVKL